ncbi:MAG: type II secretion system protein [Kiritimatiellae bacterium]|nr:type II secretion system protein [Kiritimatiellia bacterium]
MKRTPFVHPFSSFLLRATRDPQRATCSPRASRGRAAFTLIELLIVVTIMATLLALLGGGIRKSIDNARRRQRDADLKTLSSAILTYWHDTGKPPIDKDILEPGVKTYYFGAEKDSEDKKKHTVTVADNGKIFKLLVADRNDKVDNDLNKSYLDLHQLRTSANSELNKKSGKRDGVDVWDLRDKVSPMKKPGDPIVDFKGGYYRVVVDMVGKTCYLQYWDETKAVKKDNKLDHYGNWNN